MKVFIIFLLALSFLQFSNAESDSSSLNLFESLISPVFDAKCVHCHGSEKNKGKLRMDTKEGLLKGGRGAGQDIIVKGDSDSSELIYRITLPKEEDEAMPPFDENEHYNPISDKELEVLKSWIKLGASFDLLVSDLDAKTKIAAEYVLKNMPKKTVRSSELTIPRIPSVPKADDSVVNKIAEKGILIMPIAQNTNALYVNASYLGKRFDDEMLSHLSSVADQLLWLNLARTSITDKSGPNLEKFKRLTRLHLENTSVTDGIAASFSKLSNLEYLNLYATDISDQSIPHLQKLRKLKKVFLWQTKFTKSGAEKLKKSFVTDSVYVKLREEQRKLTVKVEQIKNQETKIVADVEKELLSISSVSNDSKNINSKCPVAGKPVVVDHISIFEGRKIAFCCKTCKSKFDKDSGSYRSKIENFKPSKEFLNASEAYTKAKSSMKEKIDKENEALREVSLKLNGMGPEINLGWNRN